MSAASFESAMIDAGFLLPATLRNAQNRAEEELTLRLLTALALLAPGEGSPPSGLTAERLYAALDAAFSLEENGIYDLAELLELMHQAYDRAERRRRPPEYAPLELTLGEAPREPERAEPAPVLPVEPGVVEAPTPEAREASEALLRAAIKRSRKVNAERLGRSRELFTRPFDVDRPPPERGERLPEED